MWCEAYGRYLCPPKPPVPPHHPEPANTFGGCHTPAAPEGEEGMSGAKPMKVPSLELRPELSRASSSLCHRELSWPSDSQEARASTWDALLRRSFTAMTICSGNEGMEGRRLPSQLKGRDDGAFVPGGAMQQMDAKQWTQRHVINASARIARDTVFWMVC